MNEIIKKMLKMDMENYIMKMETDMKANILMTNKKV